MTTEQIRQNAADYVYNFQPTGVITEDRLKCYIAGAHSRDEEIRELLEKYTYKIDSLIAQKEDLQAELNRLRNPWISVKDRLPDYPESEYDVDNMYLVCRDGGSFVFPAIFRRNGKWYIYDQMQTTEIITPDYWMPMPEIMKGE